MLLIDEAWSLIQHEEGAWFLVSMARQARKHWHGDLGTVLLRSCRSDPSVLLEDVRCV